MKRPASEPRGAVRVRLESGTQVIDINGPNTCEVLTAEEFAELAGRIGPDVLRKDAVPDRAFARIAKSRAPIGQLIMDQAVMAGIGNIYRTEVLWRCRVNPDTPGRNIARETFDALWADAAALLAIGVRHNAIITIEGGAPARSRYRERVNIFGKTLCPACGGEIRKFTIAARTAYACDSCQGGGPPGPA